MLINVYSPQDRSGKRKLWDDLIQLRSNSSFLRCVLGDCNVVRKPEERKGSVFDLGKAENFNMWISMGARKFTWIGQVGTKLVANMMEI